MKAEILTIFITYTRRIFTYKIRCKIGYSQWQVCACFIIMSTTYAKFIFK